MNQENTHFKFAKLMNLNRFILILLMAMLIPMQSAFSQDAERDRRIQEVEPISQPELEQALAPIALYPDTILAHILVAATYPIEVVQAERWTADNPDLEGSQAVEAVEGMDWDPSVKALVAFPQILKRLSQDLVWTQTLGDAFLVDEERVLDAVQNLRELAQEAGSLDDMDKVSVTHDDDVIVIESREREVIYVPYYDTRVVYGPWRWSGYDPIYWDYPYSSSFYAYDRYRPFYWGPRTYVSFGFYFNTFHWRDRYLVRIAPRHYRPRHYYGYNEIIRHEHAERWVHNPRHRRGAAYRNAHIQHRNYRSDSNQHYQPRPHATIQRSSQQEVRGRLRDQRIENSQLRAGQVVNPNVTTHSAPHYRNPGVNLPNRNSRVLSPGRATPVPEVNNSPIGNHQQRINAPRSAPVRTSRQVVPSSIPVPSAPIPRPPVPAAPIPSAPIPAAPIPNAQPYSAAPPAPTTQARPKRPNSQSVERSKARPKRPPQKTHRVKRQPR